MMGLGTTIFRDGVYREDFLVKVGIFGGAGRRARDEPRRGLVD